MKYRSEIDGLRALAVIPVILFHAGIEVFSGGFVGVDVFFVISGYLITTILIDEIESDRFSILGFYERRARRILPALFFVTLVCILFAWVLMNPFELKEFSQSVFSSSLFASNIYFYFKTGYFDISSELKPLLHTWSLAVEEQYYIVFPVFLCLFWRFGKNRIFWIIVIFSAFSLMLSEWSSRNNPSANFYLASTRAWELCAGSISAFFVQKRGVQSNNFLSFFGLSVVIASMLLYDKNTPFPSVYALVPVVGVMLLIVFGDKKTFVARLLSAKLFVSVGLISYSAYLWHQPVLAFLRIFFLRELSFYEGAAAVILTMFLAYITCAFIENPFRKKDFIKSKGVFLFSVSGICLFSVFGLSGHLANGYPERNPEALRLAQNFGLNEVCSGASLIEEKCKTSDAPEVVLWGDSYAMHLAKSLAKVYGNEGLSQMTLSGCPPIVGLSNAKRRAIISCLDFNSSVFDFIEHDKFITTIILSSSSDLSSGYRRDLFVETVKKLKSLGLDVILVSPTVRSSQAAECINLEMRTKKIFSNCSFLLKNAENYDFFHDLQELANILQIKFIDLRGFQCSSRTGMCFVEREEILLLRDIGHITNEATGLLSNFLSSRLLKSKDI